MRPSIHCKIAKTQLENSIISVAEITPTIILLEAASVCQLACPSCPTAEGKIKETVKHGFLKFELFKQIVDRNKNVSEIELSNWGEIFLNPDLPKIIEYAYKRGVKLRALNGVNLNTASKESLEAVVKYRFRHLNCSIDGATQEVYEIYRRRGNLANVLENIRTINDFKKKHNSPFPRLQWQFVIHGHNEHEIQAARKMAEELDMHFHPKLQWGDLYGETFSPVRDEELVRREQPNQVASRKEYKEKYHEDFIQPCLQLWQSPQINFDGKLLGCCINHWGDFGGLDGADVQSAVNNEKMSYAREMLKGNAVQKEGIPCTSCSIYKEKQRNDEWMTEKEIGSTEPVTKMLGSARTYNMVVNRLLTTKNERILMQLRACLSGILTK